MTPAEHRAEAERLLVEAQSSPYVATKDRLLREATVHALLAQEPDTRGGF